MNEDVNNIMMPRPQEKESHGALIGTIIVIGVLIVGAIYTFFVRQNEIVVSPVAGGDIVEQQLQAQSSSTDLKAIQNDLDKTDLTPISNDLDQTETQLNP